MALRTLGFVSLLVALLSAVVLHLFNHQLLDVGELLESLFTPRGLAISSSTQNCRLIPLTDGTPANNEAVILQSYSYCGGYLDVTAYVADLDYDKIVTLHFTDRNNISSPLTALTLSYQRTMPGTNYQIWNGLGAIFPGGVTRLLNVTYQAGTDFGRVFLQRLGLDVVASGAAEPSRSIPPAPYASPLGLSDDITQWLRLDVESQATLSKRAMFNNINPNLPGVANGTVIAARCGPSFSQKLPDYEYTWVRDSSLTLATVERMYAVATDRVQKAAYRTILFQYAKARADQQNAPGLQTGLGEPKFYLDNTIFTKSWGRPQNDGPATAATTLMKFANTYLSDGGDIETVRTQIYDSAANPDAPVQKDLLFVASNWASPDFDLWEEVVSAHFYTRMVQRRALLQGAEFAARMGDAVNSKTFAAAGAAISATLEQFWDPNRQLILYEYGPILRDKASYKDIAVALGVIHGYIGDGTFSYTNDRILASLVQISTSFIPVYGVANTTLSADGRPLGIPIGRYPEDIYDGVEMDGGNPWYLATATMAEMLYRAVSEYRVAGSIHVTEASLPFFDYFGSTTNVTAGSTYRSDSPEFRELLEALLGWGDAFIRRIKHHTPASGSLAEQFDKVTGQGRGAANLTWSYAALLEAAIARAEVKGEQGYLTALANLSTDGAVP